MNEEEKIKGEVEEVKPAPFEKAIEYEKVDDVVVEVKRSVVNFDAVRSELAVLRQKLAHDTAVKERELADTQAKIDELEAILEQEND